MLASMVEPLAVVLALAYVWLAAKQNKWCWLCALVSTAIYSWLFWQVSLPFHTLLNLYYLLMAIYGWYHWQGEAEQPLAVKRWALAKHLALIGLGSLICTLLWLFTANWFDGDYLLFDITITVFSVLTTWLVVIKVLENWLYWIVINSLATYLYMQKAMDLTAALYLIYIVMAFYGYQQWRLASLSEARQ
jgi:nicotinamide mononucleotide transporter